MPFGRLLAWKSAGMALIICCGIIIRGENDWACHAIYAEKEERKFMKQAMKMFFKFTDIKAKTNGNGEREKIEEMLEKLVG